MEENNINKQKETVILKLGNSFEDLLSIIDDNVNEGKDTAALFMLERIAKSFNKIITGLQQNGILTSDETVMIKYYFSRVVVNEREIINSKEKIRLLESNEAIRSFNRELQETQDMYKYLTATSF